MYDVIIVGGGPAGLAAALSAKRRCLDYLVIERAVIANTIYTYPIARTLFSTSNEVELERGALGRYTKPTREQVLDHYTSLIARERINLHTTEEVRLITPAGGEFLVRTNEDEYRARSVLVAIGGFGCRRELGVPGENQRPVHYSFSEAYPYALKSVLVVGGGNSAAEAALCLAEAGAEVTLSIRRPSLGSPEGSIAMSTAGARVTACGTRVTAKSASIKPWVLEPLERAASEGLLRVITSSEVVEIRPRSALIKIAHGTADDIVEIECDHIFALIGADPDTQLLRQAGAEIGSDGRPIYDDNCETTVAGLYVAGHITRELHLKNAIEVARRVIEHIAAEAMEQSVT